MKKNVKIILIVIGVLVILSLIIFLINYTKIKNKEKPIINSNMKFTMKAVIMEVHDNSLSVMGIENNNAESLYFVSMSEEGNIGFKKGQEVLIYFDGGVAESYPAQIYNVGKIEIAKEKSDIEIPDDVIRYYNNTKDKVDIYISELNNRGISINITDLNELPYEYSNDYVIYKEIKNEEYTGIGHKIGEDTENSTSGYTGTGTEYIWKELEKKSNVKVEETIEDLIYNESNKTEKNNRFVIGKKINWIKLYGELNDGKYRLVFLSSSSFHIAIEFSIDNEEAEIISIEKGI